MHMLMQTSIIQSFITCNPVYIKVFKDLVYSPVKGNRETKGLRNLKILWSLKTTWIWKLRFDRTELNCISLDFATGFNFTASGWAFAAADWFIFLLLFSFLLTVAVMMKSLLQKRPLEASRLEGYQVNNKKYLK